MKNLKIGTNYRKTAIAIAVSSLLMISGTALAQGSYVINENGQIDDPLVSTDSYYIKPVINIRSDVTITGDGTMSNPYQIS